VLGVLSLQRPAHENPQPLDILARGNPVQRRPLHLTTEDAMAKAIEASDETAQNDERQPKPQPAHQERPDKLDGKSFQVNENSVVEGESVHSSPPPPSEKRNEEKIQGNAFQVNENRVEYQDPALSPTPPKRE
jgi:hypothetical protein